MLHISAIFKNLINYPNISGNINLYHLTSSGNYMLRIEMESFNGTLAYAEYKVFQVGPPSLHFPLTVSGYSGTAGRF